MTIKFGSRIFAPQPFTTIVTLLLLVALIALGRWQLNRADQKRTLFEAFSRGTDATVEVDLRTPVLPRYRHVSARGAYDGTRQILIDNMTDLDGRAGYFVVTPFALVGGGWLLVNRGWVPLGPTRAVLPSIDVSAGLRTISGRADHLPSPGIHLGTAAALGPPFPVVADFPAHADLERLLGGIGWSAGTELVLLDADQPDGYVRHWQPPGFAPLRHVAYAVQWFGLAAALGVIYLVTNLRRVPLRAAA